MRGPWVVDIFLSSVLAPGWRLGRGGYPEFRAESAAERLQSLPRPLLQGPGTAPLLSVRGGTVRTVRVQENVGFMPVGFKDATCRDFLCFAARPSGHHVPAVWLIVQSVAGTPDSLRFNFGPDFKHAPPSFKGKAFAHWPGMPDGIIRADCPSSATPTTSTSTKRALASLGSCFGPPGHLFGLHGDKKSGRPSHPKSESSRKAGTPTWKSRGSNSMGR